MELKLKYGKFGICSIRNPMVAITDGSIQKNELSLPSVAQQVKTVTTDRSQSRGVETPMGDAITSPQSLLTLTLPPTVYSSKLQTEKKELP